MLREELGRYADQVTFVDMAEVGRNPARIIPLWQSLLDENPNGPVRGLSEPVYSGRSSAEIEEAKLHEALLNIAFEHSGPFRMHCPYDASILSPDLSITESHQVVLPSRNQLRRRRAGQPDLGARAGRTRCRSMAAGRRRSRGDASGLSHTRSTAPEE